MALPMFMLFYKAGTEIHLCLYMLVAIGSALTGVLLIYHGKLIVKNNTTHEKNRGSYDMGTKENLRLIFGDKWLLSLLWPFTNSVLPKIYWNTAESHKSK